MWRLAFSIVLTFAVSSVYAKKHDEVTDSIDKSFTAREVFIKLHSPALEILPVDTRLDMLDYWDVDSIYKATNAMDGLSWLVNLKDDYLKVQISKVSTLELKILPYKEHKLVLSIYTVGSEPQASDSQIDFLDENLIAIERDKVIEYPQLKDFFEIPKGSLTSMKEIRDMIPFPTMAFSANPDNNNLKAILTVEEFINQDDWNIIKLFLKPEITFDWKKDKYRLVK